MWIYLIYDVDEAMFAAEIYRREGGVGSSEQVSLKDFLACAERNEAEKLNEFIYAMMS